MILRCRDGDLALVVHDVPGCESNIGHTVLVRGPINVNAVLQLPCWLIRPVHRVPWKVMMFKREPVTQYVEWRHKIEHPDVWLLPLREITGEDAEWGIEEMAAE